MKEEWCVPERILLLDITVYNGWELVSFLSSLEKQLIQRLPELTDRPASRAVSQENTRMLLDYV